MFNSYQLTMYRTVPELTIVNNEIAIKDKRFENTAAIVKWCRNVEDDETRAQRSKAVRDLVLKQQKILKNFAAKFMQHIQHDPQFSTVARHESEWQDFIIITFNAQQRQKRLKNSIRIMKRY